MPVNIMSRDPCAWRYTDYLRTGSIYTLPDDHRLQRGPTLVVLPDGKEIKVPATSVRKVASQSQQHDTQKAQASMADLLKLMTLKPTGPPVPPGFKSAPSARPQIGRHPFLQPRLSQFAGHHFHF
jgi:hypothetical protein